MTPIRDQSLLDLSPTAFENLVFDLIRAGPLRNPKWRTPGPDGGRDIEGTLFQSDFAGTAKTSKWHIECKRYADSVSWPVVWEKVAYADSGSADVLLIATTTTFTPKCLDEVEKWNLIKGRTEIRLWPLNEIAFRISMNDAIAFKYGLCVGHTPPALALARLAQHVARMCQAAAAHLVSQNPSEDFNDAATSLAELLQVRSADLHGSARLIPTSFLNREYWPSYCINFEGSEHSLSLFDRVGLRAFIACLRVVSRSDITLVKACLGEAEFALKGDVRSLSSGTDLLQSVCLWAAMTYKIEGGQVVINQQAVV